MIPTVLYVMLRNFYLLIICKMMCARLDLHRVDHHKWSHMYMEFL